VPLLWTLAHRQGLLHLMGSCRFPVAMPVSLCCLRVSPPSYQATLPSSWAWAASILYLQLLPREEGELELAAGVLCPGV
jgi:hypothetical protein